MPSRGTPSIRIRGFEPFTVPAPRRYIVTSSAPGRPVVCMVARPGRRPESDAARLGAAFFLMSSVFIDATEPVTDSFFCAP